MKPSKPERPKSLGSYRESRLNPATSNTSLRSSGSGRPASSINRPIYESTESQSEQRDQDSFAQNNVASSQTADSAVPYGFNPLLVAPAAGPNDLSTFTIGRSLRPLSGDLTSTRGSISSHNRYNTVDSLKSNRLSGSADSLANQSDKAIGSLREKLNKLTDVMRNLEEVTAKISEGGEDSESNFNILLKSNFAITKTAQDTMNVFQDLMSEMRAMAANTDKVLNENKDLAEANAKII